MLSKTLKESREAALFKLGEEKKALEKSRLQLETEIKRINDLLAENHTEHLRTTNDLCLVLNLPTEVACMIFELSSHSTEGLKNGRTQPLLPEVVISHVCKQWRNVSLNNPRLWTRIFFRAGNVKSISNPVNHLDTYIKRSGSLNLELFFDFREFQWRLGSEKRQKHQTTLLAMAIKEVERWKIVTLINGFDLDIETQFVDLQLASAPNLEYFVYHPVSSCRCTRRSSQTTDLTVFKGGVPKLRYFLLNFCSNFPLPPFSNITTLRLEHGHYMRNDRLPWQTLLDILSIPSLANLSVVGNVFLRPKVYSSSIIKTNNLKHLRYIYQECMTFLLPFLQAPLLETLLIREDDEMTHMFTEPNPLGIPEEPYKFPSLQTLILIDPSPTFLESAQHVMQMTQNVNNILISHSKDDDYFFHNLHVAGAFNNDCWPKLTSVTANFVSLNHLDSFVSFFLSRPKGTLTLRLFTSTNHFLKRKFRNTYEEIKEHCRVEVLKVEEENALMLPFWPPGVWRPDYAETDIMVFIDDFEPEDDW